MNEDKDRTSGLTNEEAQFMVDELNALPQRRLDMEDNDFRWYEQGEEAAKEIIELSGDPNPDWYEIAMLVDVFCSEEYDHYRGDLCWEDWSDENSLPTETIAKHLEIYRQLTDLREIPIEEYRHLNADRVDALLKPLLPDEPRIPAIDYEVACPSSFVDSWWEWKKELLSRLKVG